MRLLPAIALAALVLLGAISAAANESGQLVESCGTFASNKILRTSNRTDFDEFPWLALLVYATPSRGRAIGCGGALLSKRYVLTAAHCVTGLGGNWSLEHVRLGEYNLRTDLDCFVASEDNDTFCLPEAKSYAVERAIPHEEYDPGSSRARDIALIRLNQSVPELSDFPRPICLPTHEPIAQRFRVGGWGKLAGRRGSVDKLWSPLVKANTARCSQLYAGQAIKMADDQICAGNSTVESIVEQEPCVADSGGPLMGIQVAPDGSHRFAVFGLLTMDSRLCDQAQYPGLFVDVLRYKDWILKHVHQ